MTLPDWQAWLQEAERLLFEHKQMDEAATLAKRVLEVNPDCAEAHQILGLVLSERSRALEAIAHLNRALALQPNLVRCHNALGLSYLHLGNLDRSLASLGKALYLQPEYPFAHLIRALVWLKQGRYRDGWLEYEWRFSCGLVAKPAIPRPRWDGSPLEGRSILIDTEQGMGDVLQFLRFLPELKRQGGRIVLVVTQTPLHALLRSLPYVDEWLPMGESRPITFDLYAPLMSLPGLMGVEVATIPQTVPYVFAEAERVERWRPRIEGLPGFKVGLAWQGNPATQTDLLRSIPLEQFAALGAVPGVSLVSLQKGAGEEQIEPNRPRLDLQVLADLDRDAAFVDTAAVMQHLDLVITCDSALAHLAGALGRPVWVLLSVGSDWRWLEERTDSPWYPTARLFRQKSAGDWTGVLQEVAAALRAATAGQPLRAPVSLGDLIDKITILRIKQQRLREPGKLANVRREMELLQAVQQESVIASVELAALTTALQEVNEQLWEIEDEIRLCEKAGDFDARFIELARSVYTNNDRRSHLKRQINELLRSPLLEEKSY